MLDKISSMSSNKHLQYYICNSKVGSLWGFNHFDLYMDWSTPSASYILIFSADKKKY